MHHEAQVVLAAGQAVGKEATQVARGTGDEDCAGPHPAILRDCQPADLIRWLTGPGQ
jgi:hypothetical protein